MFVRFAASSSGVSLFEVKKLVSLDKVSVRDSLPLIFSLMVPLRYNHFLVAYVPNQTPAFPHHKDYKIIFLVPANYYFDETKN